MTTLTHNAVDHNDPSLEQLQRTITNAQRGAVTRYNDNLAVLNAAGLSTDELVEMILPTYRLSASDSHTSLTQQALQKMFIDPKMVALRDGDVKGAREANSKVALLLATVARTAIKHPSVQAQIDALSAQQQNTPVVAACA